jgi:ketosteroid isomerase-like protein
MERLGSSCSIPTVSSAGDTRQKGNRQVPEKNARGATHRDERLDALQQQLEILLAKDQIRDVLYRYARGVDRKDVELLKSCYHTDAIDAHWSFIGNGQEFAEEILKPHQMGGVPVFKHFITNVLIELDGDRAFCESSYLFTQSMQLDEHRNAAMTAEGRYLDVFERRDGEWRIFHRLLVNEAGAWSLPIPVPYASAGPFADERQRVGAFPDDPVYRGFAVSEILPEEFRTTDDNWAGTLAYLRDVVAVDDEPT